MAIRDLVFIDADGFHIPDFPTLLEALKGEFRTIYGPDVYLGADSQDGQLVGVFAAAILDMGQVAAAVYNSKSPLTAQGDALTRNVRINGLSRRVPTSSQVDVVIVGQVGTIITGGIVADSTGAKWDLPAVVVILVGGTVTVTATAQDVGALAAPTGTVTQIITPTRGWQSVTNPAAASIGNAVETDAELRIRQAKSTMIPSLSVMDGIVAAVAAIAGVDRLRGYENDTNLTDADGIPAHSIAMVVEGGDTTTIAQAIHRKKTAGTGTFGGTTMAVADAAGISTEISFMRPAAVTITSEVTITALAGYTTERGVELVAEVAAYINALGIGAEVYRNRLFTPANLGNVGSGDTYIVDNIRISRTGAGGLATTNLVIAFDEIPQSGVITLVVA